MPSKDAVWDLTKEYHGFVKKYISYEEFEDITNKFQKYEDWRRSIWLRVCQIELASQMIGFDKEQIKGIQLIFISSILETLTSIIEHKQFQVWYKENEKKLERKSTLQVFEEYQKIYSSSKNFKRFFTELDKETQIDLIPRIQVQHNSNFAPYCFQDKEKCSVPKYDHSCVYDFNKNECPMVKSDKIRIKAIKDLATHLYIMRNNFVHNSRIPLFPSKIPNGWAGETVLYDFMKGYNETEFWFANKLDIQQLHEIVMNQLPVLFKNYLHNNKK
ncbi:MAG: hypothetical protein ACFFB5_24695 [Promethearchaeota archaeon]